MNDALLVAAVTCLLITIIGGVLTQRPATVEWFGWF
jgi:hypothetical protein